MYQLTVLIQQKDTDLFGSILPDFFPFLPFYFKKKKVWVFSSGWITENFLPSPDSWCFVWEDQSTSNRKAIRWKWTRAFLPFSFGSALAMIFFFYKTQNSVCGIIFLWFSLSFYHRDAVRGAESEDIFQLKTRINEYTESLWRVIGVLAAQTMMGGKRNQSEILRKALRVNSASNTTLLPLMKNLMMEFGHVQPILYLSCWVFISQLRGTTHGTVISLCIPFVLEERRRSLCWQPGNPTGQRFCH